MLADDILAGLTASDYTPESRAVLTDAVEAARFLSGASSATSQQLVDATTALQTARASLVPTS